MGWRPPPDYTNATKSEVGRTRKKGTPERRESPDPADTLAFASRYVGLGAEPSVKHFPNPSPCATPN